MDLIKWNSRIHQNYDRLREPTRFFMLIGPLAALVSVVVASEGVVGWFGFVLTAMLLASSRIIYFNHRGW